MRLFCKHNWIKASETITESKFEHATKNANSLYEYNTDLKRKVKIPWQMCDANRKHIIIFKCDKCGKIKRFVTEF